MKRIVYVLNEEYDTSEFKGYEDYVKDEGYEIIIKSSEDVFVPEYDDIVCTDSLDEYNRLADMGENAVGIIRDMSQEGSFADCRYLICDIFDIDTDYFEKVWRRFRGIAWTIAESRRLIIRETTLEDIDDLVDIYKDPGMTAYNEPLYQDIEREKEYILEYIDKVYCVQGFGIWSVYSKEYQRVIGRAGLVYREGYEDVEIGFAIGTEFQNRGYAKEAIGLCLDMAEKMDFEGVNALVMKENESSIGLLKKFGFIYIEERVENSVTYRLYRKELM